ncbi:hypothetical protein LTS18_006150 [Coniosporium uncinatum]|uniref:Uncharacterized protein n=1 Tax=Coniosporium uncinatum TaxID=93489 RepID=A0ACC3DAU9_9PEZI|nr:hypothetical protein LTS18_006150 [Coniosporium uncinatum]
MSLKRSRSPPVPPELSDISKSGPIEDRDSVFVAHYSPTLSVKALQAQPEFKTASHRIAAWRKASSQRSLVGSQRLYTTGSDDDGEKYAGKKLEKLLEQMHIEGTVVVARWYGGILLGPVRFTHIENCAREAIRNASNQSADSSSAKKFKTENDDKERTALAKELMGRDESIQTLRALLAEKRAPSEVAAGEAEAEAVKAPIAPSKAIDYGKMSHEQLKRLDKARDATVAFILKQIDEAEVKPSAAQQDVARPMTTGVNGKLPSADETATPEDEFD